MRSLHPKAVWLFFWHTILIIGFNLFVLSGFLLLSLSMSDESMSKFFIFLTENPSAVGFILSILIIFLVFIGSLSYFWAKMTYRNYRFELGNDALRIERGVIWKKYVSIPYEKIQNVDTHRGILARLLNLSNIQVQTAGDSGFGGSGFLQVKIVGSSGYRGPGIFSEGGLPGLGIKEAEGLRDELVKRAKGARQEL